MHEILFSKQKELNMTTSQAMRCQRRAARVAQERQERTEKVLAIFGLIFILLAFAIVGTMDYQTEQAEIARWQERGVTLQGW